MHHTVNLFHLFDRVLQLLVKHAPIRHNDDRVENPICIGWRAVQMRQQVRQPCDGVRFPAPCGVLDKVVMPNPFFHDSRFQFMNHVKLMVSRENEHAVLLISHHLSFGIVDLLCGFLLMDKVVD